MGDINVPKREMIPAERKICHGCYKTRSCLDLKKQKERKEEEKKKNGS